MKQSAVIGSLAGVALAVLASRAEAFVIVVGNSKAHECFLAAKAAVNFDSGIATCDEALKDRDLTIHDLAATYINRGVLKNDKGSYDDALTDYEQGIRLDPTLGDAYVDRGAALIRMQRYDDAITEINHGMELGMSYPHIGFYNRAVAEELKGQYKESYYDFKHVLELEPNFTMASEQLMNLTATTVKKPAS